MPPPSTDDRVPTLSVCTFTDEPPARVARALQQVRDVADEIVVAVDDRVPPDVLGPLHGVADRVIRAEFDPPFEANLAWLHGECTQEWILRLDGDEVAGHALVDHLATPGWDRDITHALVDVGWVWDDGRGVLAQHPWWRQPAVRLVRNLPGLARFPTRVHEPLVVGGAHRHIEAPILHLGLVTDGRADRAAKVRRYLRQGGAVRTEMGVAANAAYYVPEQLQPPPRTVPLDPADVETVATLLAIPSERSAGPAEGAAQPAQPPARIALADRRPRRGEPGDAVVDATEDLPLRWLEGRGRVIHIRLTNRGSAAWRSDLSPTTSVHLLVPDDAGGSATAALVDLPAPVRPGTAAVITLPCPGPPGAAGPAAGRPHAPATRSTWMEVAVVSDGTPLGSKRFAVDVVPGRTVAVSTGSIAQRHLGDDLVTRAILDTLYERLPDVEPVLLTEVAGDQSARFQVPTGPSAGTVLHRSGRVGRVRAAARTAALWRDARRVRRGRPPRSAAHQPVLDALAGADALVLAPAGALASRYGPEGLWPKVAEAIAAGALGTPVLVEAASIGPLTHPVDRVGIRLLGRSAAHLSVRDGGSSLHQLRHAGVNADRVDVVPDAATLALSGRPEPPATAPDGPYAVLSLRDGVDSPAVLARVRSALDALPHDLPVVFVAHCDGPLVDDHRALDALGSTRPVRVPDPPPGHGEAAALIGGATVAVGTRFHLAVLASAGGVPSVVVADGDYDRARLASLDRSLVHAHDATDPVGEVIRSVHRALDRPAEPGEAGPQWSADRFARLLGALLPPPPSLP